jgi:selenocysteine lyase/cysteine desulfurase
MLPPQTHLFSLDPSVHYLNCAYMSPNLKSVEAAGIAGVQGKNQPHLTQVSDFFEPAEKLKSLFARLIHAPEANRVALIPSVSYGMSIVAHNLPLQAGEEILIAGEQFPSNVYPWMRLAEEKGDKLRIIEAPDTDNREGDWNEALLAAIGPQTRMLALGMVHWADGTRFDMVALRQRTQEVGAWMVVDGTQAVGAMPFDYQTVPLDALICAGYKWLLGPYGLGYAYLGPALDGGRPPEENWLNRLGSEDFSALVNYEDRYQAGAQRYEVGERSNFILLPMAIAALQQLLDWQPPRIQAYCQHLTQEPLQGLQEMGCRVATPEWRGHHLLGIRLPAGVDVQALKNQLQENKVFVSVRGSAVRVAPHLFSTTADMEALSQVITRHLRREQTARKS